LRALSKTPADRFHPVAHFADALGAVAPAAPMERRRIGRRWMMPAVGVAVVAVVAVVMLLRAGGAPGMISNRPMLAVLPFENLGPPEDEFFADGVTEEITSRLGEISGLGVVSRTSAIRYKGTTQALSDIADELGVQYVLEGTIRTDRAPDGTGQVRVTPQLIRATDDTHLWTERYTVSLAPGEVFGVQATIAEQVATALDVALLEGEQGALLRRPTEDPAAYDAYLRGRALWNRRTPNELQQAAGYFATAIAIDPEYVDAHVGLADAFAVFPTYGVPGVTRAEAFGRAEESARQALALDSMHAGAHASLANALMYARWDWEGAEREFERALSLDPDHAIAHYWYAELLTHTGRCEEALAHTGRAVELDPAAPVTHHLNGWVLLCLEQYDDAEVSERAALALGPGYFLAHANLGTIAWMRGDVETAQREWVASGMPGAVAQIIVDARRDPSRRAEAIGRLGALFRGGPPPDPAFGAYFYMLVGAIDSAVAWSERAVDARSDIFLGVLRLPSLRDALADPRMQDIVRRMGLEP
jgi:TolB-like protein/Tfp pilus assembly protein PilF